MKAGVAFSLEAALFGTSNAAILSRVRRPVIDTMSTRGFIKPSQRDRATARPLFSFRDVFKVRTMVMLSPLGMGLKDSSLMSDVFKNWTSRKSEAAMDTMADLADVADTLATKGEWMWAMARSIERDRPFYIYAYAARTNKKWQFDMHIENSGVENPNDPPCFGGKVPHIYVPVSEIFIAVYDDCKAMLGLTPGEDARHA